MVKEYKAYYEHEWLNGISTKINFFKRDLFPLDSSKFKFRTDNFQHIDRKSINTSEIRLDLRFAYKEKFFVRRI